MKLIKDVIDNFIFQSRRLHSKNKIGFSYFFLFAIKR